MKLLALETATEACSAALWIDAECRERFEIAPRRHTELILPMVDALLREADCAVAALDAVAFGRGPGAFTSVRVAASVAQGLAFGADVPVVPVSSLASLALAAHEAHHAMQVACALDARMQEVYWAAYRFREGEPEVVVEEQLRKPAAVDLPGEGAWLGAGGGWAAYESALRARLGAALESVAADVHPRAAAVARLAAQAWARGEHVPPEQAIPVYLRDQVTG